MFKEGEPNEYLYFLKRGEIEVKKKVAFPKLGVDSEDVAKLLFDPH